MACSEKSPPSVTVGSVRGRERLGGGRAALQLRYLQYDGRRNHEVLAMRRNPAEADAKESRVLSKGQKPHSLLCPSPTSYSRALDTRSGGAPMLPPSGPLLRTAENRQELFIDRRTIAKNLTGVLVPTCSASYLATKIFDKHSIRFGEMQP